MIYWNDMNKIIIGVVAVLVLGFGILFFTGDNSNTGTQETLTTWTNIQGATTSKIQIVEYADFQCPACGFMHEIIKELQIKYPNQIALTFKNFPLINIHRNALLAAKTAEAAGKQGKYFEMHDMLFETQKDWAVLPSPKEKFTEFARALSLNLEIFDKDINSKEIEDKIKADIQDGTKAKITGTPTLFINGVKVENGGIEAKIKSILEIK